MLWCGNQELGYGNICSTCPYLEYEENDLLCQLYTSIEFAQGSGSGNLEGSGYSGGSFNESGCPYLNRTDGTLICDLWCELINLELGYICSEPIDVLLLMTTIQSTSTVSDFIYYFLFL